MDFLCHRNYITSILFVPQKHKFKIGRPKLPKGEAKVETIRVRVTPSEYSSVKESAASSGKDISEWARQLILAGAKSKALPN